jgi:hypothetical protein
LEGTGKPGRNDINYRKKNTETLTDASKKVGLEVKTDKTKYMLMSHHQNARQNHYTKKDNSFFENLAKFKYLGRE